MDTTFNKICTRFTIILILTGKLRYICMQYIVNIMKKTDVQTMEWVRIVGGAKDNNLQ